MVLGLACRSDLRCESDRVTQLPSPHPPAQQQRSLHASALGTNLAPISDWLSETPFINLFRQARPWFSSSPHAYADHRPLSIDANGNVEKLAPGQYARTLVRSGNFPRPVAPYVLLYSGKGDLRLESVDVTATLPGRITLTTRPNQPIGIVMQATDASDPLRDFRLVPIGGVCRDAPQGTCTTAADCDNGDACDSFETTTATFHPAFLRTLQHYGTIRFMDWFATNNAPKPSWSTRPTEKSATYTQAGAPIEVALALTTTLGTDAWINIPHEADDDYIRRFARVVREHAADHQRIYVEYSNEVWNGIFSQSKYARDQGLAAGLDTNPFAAQLKFYAQRSEDVFRMFSEEFQGSEQLVFVLASQFTQPLATKTIIEHAGARRRANVLAIAPYWGGEVVTFADRLPSMSVDDLFTMFDEEWLPRVERLLKEQVALASTYGLAVVAYEGGQHLTIWKGADNDAANTLLTNTNRDARMKSAYLRYLNVWRDSGAQLFLHFTSCTAPSKSGRFGALEYMEQPLEQAPKAAALAQFAQENPPWW